MSDEKKEKKVIEPEIENVNEATPPPEATNAEAKLRDELLYMRADFENAKRRLLRDQDQAVRFANEKIIGELLGIVDLFERAMVASRDLKKKNEEVTGFVTGVEMTHRELINLLSRFGVELTGNVGDKFDPNQMEAISQAQVTPAQVDKVVDVVQKGCLLQGRLLKPAKVIVGIAKENK